jgi:hypothetical protein
MVKRRPAIAEELNGKDLRPNQLFQSALPPRKGRATRIETVTDGLWTFTQPFPIPLVGDPDLRMTVATLGDGTLLVSPAMCPPLVLLTAAGNSVFMNKQMSAHEVDCIDALCRAARVSCMFELMLYGFARLRSA